MSKGPRGRKGWGRVQKISAAGASRRSRIRKKQRTTKGRVPAVSRRPSLVKKRERGLLRRGFMALLELLLMVGFFYFVISGVLTIALNTTTFWMAVTSNSMYHSGESWRLDYSSNGHDTYRFPIQEGFERGDLLVVQGISSPSQLSVGDVIIIDVGDEHLPLVHRVIEMWAENGETRLRTKGDANFASLSHELSIKPEQIVGRAVFVIPKIGHIFLWVQGR